MPSEAVRSGKFCPRRAQAKHDRPSREIERLLEFVRVPEQNVTEWCDSVGLELDWTMEEQICAL